MTVTTVSVLLAVLILPAQANSNKGTRSEIVAGQNNTIDRGAAASIIASGNRNKVNKNGKQAIVAGGQNNLAAGTAAFAAGNKAQAKHDGTFVWGDGQSPIFGSTAANQFLIRAQRGVGINTNNPQGNALSVRGNTFVNGNLQVTGTIDGQINGATANFQNLVVDGQIISGPNNLINADFAALGGGYNNVSSGTASVVGGGAHNQAEGAASVVGGGGFNAAKGPQASVGGGWGNVAVGPNTFIGGGWTNNADGAYAFVGGGISNSVEVGSSNSVVVGGVLNTNGGQTAFLGGGELNTVAGTNGFLGGGRENKVFGYASTVSGGEGNVASNSYSFIGGGRSNKVTGFATVPGGDRNEATSTDTFAAGSQSKATNAGAFVWGTAAATVSTNDNSFTVRAAGGVRFISTLVDSATVTSGVYEGAGLTNGVYLAPNSGAWASLSDSNAKTKVTAVRPREILAKVAAIPVTEWEYKVDPNRRYIGPMAQDFHAAFGLGYDDKSISTLDSDGVMYAAIQGLVEELHERDKQIEELRAKSAEVDALKAKLDAVEKRLNSLPPSP